MSSGYNVNNTVGIGSTTVGANNYAGGQLTASFGAYNIMTTDYQNGYNLFGLTSAQNFGSIIVGSLNSIESYESKKTNAGVASSIVGIANQVKNSNGAVIMGAGNSVTNSLGNVNTPTYAGSAEAAAEQIRNSTGNGIGGAVAVIGGGNKVDKSQAVFISGQGNTISNVKDSAVLGSKVDIKNVSDVISMGNENKVTANKGVAIGAGAEVSKEGSVAIGAGSKADRDNSVAVGGRVITNAGAATQDGDVANYKQVKDADTATLTSAKTYADTKVQSVEKELGGYVQYDSNGTDKATVTFAGKDGTALKNVSDIVMKVTDKYGEVKELSFQEAGLLPGTAYRDTSVSIGRDSNASGSNSTTVGTSAKSSEKGVAIGSYAWGAEKAVAIGGGTFTDHTNTNEGGVAIGYNSYNGAKHAVSIGEESNIWNYGAGEYTEYTSTYAVSIGGKSTVYGNDSVAVGGKTQIGSKPGVGSTYPSHGKVDQATAIGNNSEVWSKNSVALGFGSVVGPDQENVVSVGNSDPNSKNAKITRRIINVADGTADTDAATVGQLKKKANAADLAGLVAYDKNGTAVNKDSVSFGGGEKGTTLNNVGDIVMKVPYQDKADGYKTVYKDLSFQKAGLMPGEVVFDDNFKEDSGNSIVKGNVVAIGGNTKSTNSSGATVLGAFGSIENSNFATALGTGTTITDSTESTAIGNNASVFHSDWSTAIGKNASVMGIYDSTTKKYVNVKENTAIGQFAGVEGANSSVALGAYSKVAQGEDNVVSVGNSWLKRKITNVADGVKDTDAATVGQVTKATDGVKALVGTADFSRTNYAKGSENVTQAIYDVDAQVKTNADGLVTTNTKLDALDESAVKYDTKTVDGKTEVDKMSVTFNPGGTATTLKNVAAGELAVDSKEAVNGSQLYAEQDAREKADKTFTDKFKAYEGAGIVAGTNNGESSNLVLGTGSVVGSDVNNAVVVGRNADVSAKYGTALGDSAKVYGINSVALGADSIASENNVVSVGSTGQERKIVNVAAGTADTDAVNYGQLKQVSDVASAGFTVAFAQPDGSVQKKEIKPGNTVTVTGNNDNILAKVDEKGQVNVSLNDSIKLGDQKNPGVALDGNEGTLAVKNANGGLNVTKEGTVSAWSGANGVSVSALGTTVAGDVTVLNENTGLKVTKDLINATADDAYLTVGKNGAGLGYGDNNIHVNDQGTYIVGKFNATAGGNVGGVKFTGVNEDGLGKVTNVAAGVANTDAVNKGQLDAVSGDVTDLGHIVGDGKYTSTNYIAQGDTLTAAASKLDTQVKVNADEIDKLHTAGIVAGEVTGKNSIALGQGSVAAGDNATVVGNASVTGDNGTAIGQGATAEKDATALGNKAYATENSVALGNNAVTKLGVTNAVALGANSVATESNTVSVGAKDNERKIVNIAAGTNITDAVNYGQLQKVEETANKGFSVAIQQPDGTYNKHTYKPGDTVTVNGKNANILAGVDDKGVVNVSLNDSIKLGDQKNPGVALDGNEGTLAVKNANGGLNVTKEGTVSAWSGANGVSVSALGTTVAGDVTVLNENTGLKVTKDLINATADDAYLTVGKNGAGVGYGDNNIHVNDQGTYVVGKFNATAGGNVGGVKFTGVNEDGLGKVTNVAAGVANTDAVNKGQLDAVSGDVTDLGNIVGDGKYTSTNYIAQGDTLTAAASKLDTQVKVNADEIDKLHTAGIVAGEVTGKNSIALGQGSVAAGDNATVVGNASVTGDNGTAIGQGATAEKDATALGHKAYATENSVALGNNAVTKLGVTNAVALGANSVATESNTVSVGAKGNERKIVNVAAGTADTDAVNYSQIKNIVGSMTPDGKVELENGGTTIIEGINKNYQNFQTLDANAVQYKKNTDEAGNVTFDTSVVSFKGANGTTLKNVAAGTADTDAVNVSQLNAKVGSAKTEVKAGDNVDVTKTTDKDGHDIYQVALKDQIALTDEGSVTIGSTGNSLSKAGLTINQKVYINKDGINANSQKITNVAAGTDDTDAVNKGQLDKTVADATNGSVKWDEGTTDTINGVQVSDGKVTANNGISAGNGNFNVDDKGNLNIGNGKFTVDAETGNTSIGGNLNVNGGLTVNGKDVATSESVDKINNKLGSGEFTNGKETYTDAINQNTADIKTNADNIATNTKNIGDVKQYEKAGINGTDGKAVTNVVDATISNKQAITAVDTKVGDGKLDSGASNLTEGINQNYQAIQDNSKAIGVLDGAVTKLDTRVDRVGAGAAALAALHPLDYDPANKWDFAAGYGHYKGANAVSIGTYYRPNETTMFSVGGSFGGGENMVNAGVSFKLGSGNSGVSTSRTAMAAEIDTLKSHNKDLEDKVAAQDKKVQELEKLVQELIKNQKADK